MEKTKRDFFEITVKAVVVNEKGEALLIKRPMNNHHGSGKWDFPGGKLEAGEYIKNGLEREIKEELGIEVETEIILLADDFGNKYDKEYEIGKEKILVSGKGLRFLAFYKSGEIKLSKEHEKFEWFPIEKALNQFGESDFEKDKIKALKEAQKYLELKESLSGWKRCQADFENYKKRQAEDRRNMVAFSNLNLISEILPVIDNFHASTDHIPDGQKESAWVVGIMHIQKQLEKVLEDNGVKEVVIKAGDKFNPEVMEAISQEERRMKDEERKDDGRIKKVVQKGYEIDGKIIRAARVIVE